MNKIFTLDFVSRGNLPKAIAVVPFFYYFLVFVSTHLLAQRDPLIRQGATAFKPILPIWWASNMDYEVVVTAVLLAFLCGAVLGAVWYRCRWARFAAAMGILQYNAFLSSFQVPDHHTDLWFWVAVLFVFLPNVWRTESPAQILKERFLTLFWGAQALALLVYTMAGMWKMLAAAEQVLAGQPNIFSLDASALHISTQFLRQSGEATSIFGPLIIAHPLAAWLPLICVMYLQLFAFWIAFKPNLHRTWGLALACMHIAIYLTLFVQFFHHVFVLLLLLAESPFQKNHTSWKEWAYDFPIVGFVARKLSKRMKA